MNRLNHAQLAEMFRLQSEMNAVVNPDWIDAGYHWGRAIRVECAELSDHIGWKWWKAQAPNWPQARIELVDIWHFMLSAALVQTRGDVDEAVSVTYMALSFPHSEYVALLGKRFCIAGSELHEKIDMLSLFASLNYTHAALFEAIMVDCDFSWEELRAQYVAKNTLNLFRQRHGYKEGRYLKTWHGEEDNVWLERIIAARPSISNQDLNEELWKTYEAVLSAEGV